MLLEAATGRSKYCGTVMSRLSDGTQWTVMVKLVIAMMQIAIPRPWSDLRYATTSESARRARVPREERECAANAGEDMELFFPKHDKRHDTSPHTTTLEDPWDRT